MPTLDGVAFIDPRRSEVDIVQAVGRAIRRAPDKTVGTIVIPVFIDTDEAPTVALAQSAFAPVWEVIKALRSHDEELGEQLDELRRQLGRGGRRSQLPEKIHFDLPSRVGIDFAHAFDVRLVEQTTASWEFWFGLLQRFVELNGHARAPANHVADGYQLGAWINTQRTSLAKGTLAADRRQRLGQLPGWSWEPHDDNWEKGFSHLSDYVARNGHAQVPYAHKVDGYRLGVWVTVQRRTNNKGTLDPDRRTRLQELPGWAWDPQADKWEEGFSHLARYVESNGDARVPHSYTVEGYKLGAFVVRQRTGKATGTLDPDRERRLKELPGWTWDTRADKWEEGFRILSEYVNRNGHARVPHEFEVDGYALGQWVLVQRVTRAKGTLEPDREQRLEKVPGWTWDTRADKWEEGFGRLTDYVKQHGHARVPKSYTVDNYQLGSWVNTQRGAHAKGTLDAERADRLGKLPGWTWGALANRWDENFCKLEQYVEENGDARIPASYVVDGYPLGEWVKRQRRYYAKGILEADRQDRLRRLPAWTWDPYADQWEEGISRLTKYVETNGHALVPQKYSVDGYQLARCVGRGATPQLCQGHPRSHAHTSTEAGARLGLEGNLVAVDTRMFFRGPVRHRVHKLLTAGEMNLAATRRYGDATAKRCHSPGTPLSS